MTVCATTLSSECLYAALAMQAPPADRRRAVTAPKTDDKQLRVFISYRRSDCQPSSQRAA